MICKSLWFGAGCNITGGAGCNTVQMKKMMIPTVLSVLILSQIASPVNSGYNVSNARNGPMKSVWKLGLHTFATIVTVMTQIFSIRSSNVCTITNYQYFCIHKFILSWF